MSKIAIVGVEGSGKTVLMAALGEMYGQMSNDSLYLMPENQAAFAFMTRIPHKMRVERQWPEATAIESMKYLKWTVRIGSEVLAEVDMLDYPGELYRMAFGDRKQEEIEGTKAQIHEFLEHLVTADDLIVLFNLKDAMDIGSNARNNETVWLTRGIFDYAKKLANIKNQLLLFTQADRYSKLLEEVGGAQAAQVKYLPMLSVLHPNLESAAISAVEASESNVPGINSVNRGLSSLMHRIVLSSEIGRRELESFEKYELACGQALRAYVTRYELNEAIQQLKEMATGIGSVGTGLINALFPGALNSCAGQVQILESFLSDIDLIISAHSQDDLPNEQPWQSLLEKYSDSPEFVATIRNLINDYDALKKQREVARLNEMRQNRIVRFGVVAFLLIAVGFIAHSTYDSRVDKLARQTGLPKPVCSSALWRDPDAQHLVGRAFLSTTAPSYDPARGIEWLLKAAERGHKDAQMELCDLFAEFPTLTLEADAAKKLVDLSDNENSWAKYILSRMYLMGSIFPYDKNIAEKLHRSAADGGNILAILDHVWQNHSWGEDSSTNSESIEWFKKAEAVAKDGSAIEQFHFSQCFMYGVGADKNENKAIMLCRKAAEDGYAPAQLTLALWLSGDERRQEERREAEEWFIKAAKVGDVRTLFTIGNYYEDGNVITKDEREALKWYIKSANTRGEIGDYLKVASMYSTNHVYTQDRVQAHTWNIKAVERLKAGADKGQAWSQASLAKIYKEGEIIAQDLPEAVDLFTKAANEGDAYSQRELASMYEKGTGVTKDYGLALRWYAKAETNSSSKYFTDEVKKDLARVTLLKAADAGEAEAQYKLSLELGHDYRNRTNALDWLVKSAAQGYPQAQHDLGSVYRSGWYNGQRYNKDPAIAHSLFLNAAKQGHAESQNTVGLMYENGEGVATNLSMAAEWYTKSAEQGFGSAHVNLAHCYLKGKGVETNYTQAHKWFEKARAQNISWASAHLAEMYIKGYGVTQNVSRAITLYEEAFARGDVSSPFALASLYEEGKSVPQDIDKAIYWYRNIKTNGYLSEILYPMAQSSVSNLLNLKQAIQGDAQSQNTVGEYYRYRDDAKAIEWFLKAAEQGNAKALYNLGGMYESGNGVEKNQERADELIFKAAEKGDAEAQNRVGVRYSSGRGLPKDPRKAVEWYRKSADQGDPWGQYNLATHYENGTGIIKDVVTAAELYLKSAEQRNADAQNKMGILYYNGQGVPQDRAKAFDWFFRAACNYNSWGEYNLGMMYYDGIGVQKNYTEAYKHFYEATKYYRQPNSSAPSAQYQLGEMYEYGRGVQTDYSQALSWYKQAETNSHPGAAKARERVEQLAGKPDKELLREVSAHVEDAKRKAAEKELLRKVADQIEDAKRNASGTVAP